MKITLPLSLLAAATLGACATYEAVTPAPQAAVVTTQPVVVGSATAPGTVTVAPGTTVQPQVVAVAPAVVGTTAVVPALRPGFGRVDSISPVASTGTGGNMATQQNRLAVRMDDGTMQYLDTRAAPAVGERVQVTPGGEIGWPIPASR